MRTAVTTIRIEPEIIEKVKESSKDDMRKYSDQVNYLLTLGLKYRQQIKVIEQGKSQINMEAFR